MTRLFLPRLVLPFCMTVLFAVCASPASAALDLCNRTSYVLYASTGEASASNVVTHGWTRIAPGSCAVAIAGPLRASGAYVYARTSRAHRGPAHAWGGKIPLCVKDTDFSLQLPAGTERCPSDDSFVQPFARIDTKGKTSWTTAFTLSPDIASLAAARDAGIARLLGDIGYKSGRGGAGTTQALDKFRIRMKIPATAGSADLFDALETEALKVAAPAGYSICNDTDAPFWAALGQKTAKAWTARGWWKVLPGACAHAIATPLSTDKIYLRVDRKGGPTLVSGPNTFCVTGITFEIEGRERCTARGLTAAGFAATDTRGHAGFAAYVGENGLLPPLRTPD